MSQEEAHHPTAKQYFRIAMVLSVITAIEVGIFYLEFLGYWMIPILVVLSTGKFALVAMYYMHLRYEHRLFSYLFVTGVVLATVVISALVALFSFGIGRW
ncbi:MAG: cytochrome C oxidase subunit IV family protein [Dehalococcoidia bacterium]|tara:strand:+ start:2040 stop:2339 length:300 start_codon:yes stop_codon:yes gene_type:complete